LALELDRLDELQQTFHEKAMQGDVASGALLVKIAERRATLLGLNSPTRVDAVIEVMQVNEVNSTDKVRLAINRIRGIEPPKPN
jgi:hypothetical protein